MGAVDSVLLWLLSVDRDQALAAGNLQTRWPSLRPTGISQSARRSGSTAST